MCRLVLPVIPVVSPLTADALAALLPLAFAIMIAANIWALVTWIWKLPVSRLLAFGILCSLSFGITASGSPYWVARFRGHRADLRRATLIAADLDGSNLSGANLSGANLHGASLRGANLEGADLHGVVLAGAMYDEDTRWPDSFDPCVHGARVDPCGF